LFLPFYLPNLDFLHNVSLGKKSIPRAACAKNSGAASFCDYHTIIQFGTQVFDLDNEWLTVSERISFVKLNDPFFMRNTDLSHPPLIHENRE